MLQLKYASIFLFFQVIITSAHIPLKLTCFQSLFDDYTCGFEGMAEITSQTTWIVPQHPQGLGNDDVRTFFIKRASVMIIPIITFTTFTNLQSLRIELASVLNLITDLPMSYESLKNITLNQNREVLINNNAFVPFPNTKVLLIKGNAFLGIIGSEQFNGLVNLEDLTISFNTNFINMGTSFAQLGNLSSLTINDNIGILKLHSRTFTGLTNLQYLNLERSRSVTIPTNSFQPLANLEILHLSENFIVSIAVSIL